MRDRAHRKGQTVTIRMEVAYIANDNRMIIEPHDSGDVTGTQVKKRVNADYLDFDTDSDWRRKCQKCGRSFAGDCMVRFPVQGSGDARCWLLYDLCTSTYGQVFSRACFGFYSVYN